MNTITDSTTITVRVSQSVRDRLETLAQETKRRKSALAAEAIGAFDEIEQRQIAGIKRGLVVAQEDVEAWVASWDTDEKLPPPTVA